MVELWKVGRFAVLPFFYLLKSLAMYLLLELPKYDEPIKVRAICTNKKSAFRLFLETLANVEEEYLPNVSEYPLLYSETGLFVGDDYGGSSYFIKPADIDSFLHL